MSKSSCDCSNLNHREVQKRKILGYTSFITAFALVGWNKVTSPPDWVLWMPAVPFFFGYLGLFQARTKTCVALALADRDMSEGKLCPMKDRATGRRLKKRSAKILLGAGALALVTTAVCLRL